MSDDDGPTWDEIEAKYRLPGGGWNWPAMPIDVYRRVDAYDFSSGNVSVGSGAPTEYTSYSIGQRVQMDRDEYNRENEPRPMTPKAFARVVGMCSGIGRGSKSINTFETIRPFLEHWRKLRARKK